MAARTNPVTSHVSNKKPRSLTVVPQYARRDLNPRPFGPQPNALSPELRAHVGIGAASGAPRMITHQEPDNQTDLDEDANGPDSSDTRKNFVKRNTFFLTGRSLAPIIGSIGFE